ncbi:MAG: hypothetical protein FWF51_06395, partial [Chitinivibrionia bacterium]|nr:hypothetical protein [Chitinivibrionia bacterium]
MNKFSISFIVIGLVLSFILDTYQLRKNDAFIKKVAPNVFVNCEISKQYADSINIVLNLYGLGDTVLQGIPLNTENCG